MFNETVVTRIRYFLNNCRAALASPETLLRECNVIIADLEESVRRIRYCRVSSSVVSVLYLVLSAIGSSGHTGDPEHTDVQTCLRQTIIRLSQVAATSTSNMDEEEEKKKIAAFADELHDIDPRMIDVMFSDDGGFDELCLAAFSVNADAGAVGRAVHDACVDMLRVYPHTNLTMNTAYDCTTEESQKVHDKKHSGRTLDPTSTMSSVTNLLEHFRRNDESVVVGLYDEENVGGALRYVSLGPTHPGTYEKLLSATTTPLTGEELGLIRSKTILKTLPHDLLNYNWSKHCYDPTSSWAAARLYDNSREHLKIISFLLAGDDVVNVSSITNNSTAGPKINTTLGENVSRHFSRITGGRPIEHERLSHPLTKLVFGVPLNDGEGKVVIGRDEAREGTLPPRSSTWMAVY